MTISDRERAHSSVPTRVGIVLLALRVDPDGVIGRQRLDKTSNTERTSASRTR